MAAQRREFRNYTLDQQIDIHLEATARLHPPDFEFGAEIARKGRGAIPALLSRLKTAKNDRDRAHIMFVFQVMAQLHEPVAADEGVVATLRVAVAAMRDPFWKKHGERSLELITVGWSDFLRIPERRERRD